ncbi:MAG TPA: hypothetical protein VJG83_01670 [archaeon]|nr:hypothetical protein [archaeon]
MIEPLKQFYYSLEDKYYEVLDKIDEKVPVYSVIDPIDKYVPSFLLFLLLVLALLVGLFFAIAGDSLFSTQKSADFVVLDPNGDPLPEVEVLLTHGSVTDVQVSDAFGEFSILIDGNSALVEIDEGDSFEHFSQTIEIEPGIVNEIRLSAKEAQVLERFLEIKDENGRPFEGASIRFTCSKGLLPPNTITNAKSTERILASTDCGILSAVVTAFGYEEVRKDLTVTRTVIVLTPISSGDELNSEVVVFVEDKATGNAAAGIDLKLYTKDNVWAGQGQSDNSGAYIFEASPGEYFIRASDLSPVPSYKNSDSEFFILEEAQSKNISISLEKIIASEARNIVVKYIDKSSKQPIAGVMGVLHDGNVIAQQDSSKQDGIIPFYNVEQRRLYSLISTHAEYVLKVSKDIPLKSGTDSNPFVVELEKATAQNSGKVVVSVKGFDSKPVSDAKVEIYSSDHNFSLLSSLTSQEGSAIFSNMPLGKYHAQASASGQNGKSDEGALVAGSDLLLSIVLVLENGSIELEAVDRNNNPVADAKVSFFDAIVGKIGQSQTAQNGIAPKAEFKVNLKPYALVEKQGFLPHQTIALQLSANQTTKVRAVLREEMDNTGLVCDSNSSVCIGLLSILKTNRQRATILNDNSSYILVFEVKSDGNLSETKAVVRTGLDSQLTANDSLVVVKKVNTPLASAVKFSNFNATDPYADAEVTPNDGKQAKVSFGNLGRGTYIFEVEVFIKSTEQEDAPIEIRYGASAKKNGTTIFAPPQGLFLEKFILNKPLECDPSKDGCNNFIFQATLSEAAKTHLLTPVVLSATERQQLREDVAYNLGLVIHNTHTGKKTFSNVVLKVETDNGAVSTTPASIPISQFAFGTSSGFDVALSAIRPSAATLLKISLGLQEQDANISFPLSVAEKGIFLVEALPQTLTAGVATNLVIKLSDSVSKEAVRGAIVKWYSTRVDAEGKINSISALEATHLGNGFYTAQIPARSAGQNIFITAEKAGYQTSSILEIISQNVTFPVLTSGFDCISIDKEKLQLARGGSSQFTLSSNNCPSDVEVSLFVPSASNILPNLLQSGPITLKGGSSTITQCEACVSSTLRKGANLTITALGDKLSGHYDVYVRARYVGEQQFSQFKVVEVEVMPLATDNFDLSKSTFDIFAAKDSAFATNRNDVAIGDFWIPKVSFDLESRGKYSAVQQRFETIAPVSFSWTVNAKIADFEPKYVKKSTFIIFGNPPATTPLCEGCTLLCRSDKIVPGGKCENIFSFKRSDYGLEKISGAQDPKLYLEEIWYNRFTRIILNTSILFQDFNEADCSTSDPLRHENFNGTPIDITEFLKNDNSQNDLLAISWPNKGCSKQIVAKFRVDYMDIDSASKGPLVEREVTKSEDEIIIPEEGKIYDLGTILPQDLGQINNLDPTFDFIELNVTNTSGGLFETWLEGTVATGISVKGRYVGDPRVLSSSINFDVVNSSLSGRDYGILEVKDYISATQVPNFTDVAFAYTIESRSATSSQTQVQQSSVRANGLEKELGKISPSLKGPGVTYIISDDSEFAVTYFKDAQGKVTFRTADPQATVYVRTAFNMIAARTLDIAFLFDTSGSMDNEWITLCARRDEILTDLRSKGFDVQYSAFGMLNARNSPSGQPCTTATATWPSAAGISSQPNPFTDSLDESWGPDGVDAINKFGWRPDSRRVLVVIGDNAPSGRNNFALSCSPYVEGSCYWRAGVEEKLADDLITAAKAKNISVFFFYPSDMESTVTNLLGATNEGGPRWDSTRNDAVELMEYVAAQTGGVVETYESEVDQTADPIDRFILLIQKSTHPIVSEYFHVRVDSGKEGVCYGPGGIEGATGRAAVPRILPSWNWNVITTDTCDAFKFDSGAANSEFVYCDATQFTTEIVRKLERVKRDTAAGNFSSSAKIAKFNAYLMRDGYSSDFLQDYLVAMTQLSFFNTPTSFTNDADGFKKIFSDAKIKFIGKNHSVTPLPASGLYEVSVSLKFGSAGQWVFFTQQGSNVEVDVTLELKDELDSTNALYYMPIDGMVGATPANVNVVDRVGYGTGFSGQGDSLKLYSSVGGGEITISGVSPASQPIASVALSKKTDFVITNQLARSKILSIAKTGQGQFDLTYAPSNATPLMVQITKPSSSTDAPLFLQIKQGAVAITGLDYLSVWNGVGSDLSQCRSFDGQALIKAKQDLRYSSYSVPSQSCKIADPQNSFGFYWAGLNSGIIQNNYYQTVIYTPNKNFSILNACEATNLRIVTPGADISGTTPVLLDYGQSVNSLSEIFKLVEDGKVCVSSRVENNTERTEFWWNEQKIAGELANARKQLFCTSASAALCAYPLPSQFQCT